MRFRKQNGAVAVEMALVLLPMLILCFGITEIGRALYQYNGLVKATRGATRYLSQQSVVAPPIGETADDIRLRARNFALCGSVTCVNATPLVTGLTLGMISVCDRLSCSSTHGNVSTGAGSVNLVTVSIGVADNKFRFTSIVPWVVPDILFKPISVTMASSTN
jgi:Flp pilus assembly protein TadG